MAKLVVVDANSIIYRAFHALPLLANSSGLHTNAVFGFTNILLKILKEENPTHIFVAFDQGKKTFRNDQFPDYKATRAPTAPELKEQFPLARELVTALNIEQLGIEGYEADDIVGTITKWADANNIPTVAVTGDKDYLQLVSDNTSVILMKKGVSEVELYDPAKVVERYTLNPQQIIDLKGLMGDKSDNIPGVPSIGEKTAIKLLNEYESVEGVLSNIDKMKGKMKETFEQYKNDAILSKQLATIFREVPMETELDRYVRKSMDEEKVVELFKRLEFKSLLSKLDIKVGNTEKGKKTNVSFGVVTEFNASYFVSKLNEVESIYVEAPGENPHVAEILGIAFHTPTQNFYMPYATLMLDNPYIEEVTAFLKNPAKPKVVHDLNRNLVLFNRAGITLQGVKFDTLLAAYLSQPTGADNDLSYLGENIIDFTLPSDEEIYGKGAKFVVPSIEVLAEHACKKVYTVHTIVEPLKEKLNDHGLNELFYNLEIPLARVLADLEIEGIKMDIEQIRAYGDEIADRIDVLEHDIFQLAGSTFNVGSPKKLGDVLFVDLGLPVVKKTKTGFSTDADVLDKLSGLHPIVPKISEHRALTKLQSMFIEGLQRELHSDGKIHTYYNQGLVVTGRLSSQFPNMQNIPTRTEDGRKVRKAFVPSKEGNLIMSADYSQIELRILAHISQDPRMKEAFLNDMDIHTKTAMDVFGVAEHEVTKDMRRRAKAVNFGIVYGISDFGLSQNLNITRKEASEFIETYLKTFEGVQSYMNDIIVKAKEQGYVTTLLNRRRSLPDINASNFTQRSFAERTAMNTPIQGTAADVIKIAMINLQEAMKQRQLRSKMLLQVHDELVFEVEAHELEVMKDMVRTYMESAMQLSVPLKVDISYGKDWYEAK